MNLVVRVSERKRECQFQKVNFFCVYLVQFYQETYQSSADQSIIKVNLKRKKNIDFKFIFVIGNSGKVTSETRQNSNIQIKIDSNIKFHFV